MKARSTCRLLGVLVLSIITANLAAASAAAPRERLLLDFGWKFHLGNEWGFAQNLAKAASGHGPANASFSDAGWRTVNLPHDWAVELPFDSRADGSHGFKPVGRGFESNSVAWYRRTFELPKEDADKRLWLEFDGAFRDCAVFVNNWCVGHHESGYSSFRCDITDVANCGGKNVVAVRVDASQFEGWFYEGAGIYRHVWLVKTSPLAIAPDGILVWSEPERNVLSDKAQKINVEVHLLNSLTNYVGVKVKCRVISPEEKLSAETYESEFVRASATEVLHLNATVLSPDLWSPESPKLYKLVTTVESDGQIVDRQETEFGIRTVAFDATNGFLLNGRPYVLKGTCNHQDHAGVGAALPDRLQYFRVAKLKEMGCNAYRASHNPPTPELLEACDRLGMLVMDESRLLGSDAQNMARLEGLIRRDRNHPSVVIWSIANEEFSVQTSPVGGRVAETMQARIKQLDPTRPVTYAANVGNEFAGINRVIEVRGWNYYVGPGMDDYHRAHPAQPNVGTEQASTVGTRGIYTNDKQRGYVSAYDENNPRWGSTAESWWSFFAERPWLSGGFVWTGFDYRGEPTPYWWPCINSHFGIMDTCGFPKDNFFYYQSWWSDKPVLHLLPHWNWPGKEGQEIEVRALSNCDEVELFLNRQSLGRQTMKKNSHLKWTVKYAPGTLYARGYRGGVAVAGDVIQTAGAPAAIRLAPDRDIINADGEDISVVTVSVLDAENRLMPVASNLIQFDLAGPGRILGVGNGDPSCHEPDVFIRSASVRSIPLKEWRWKKLSDVRRPDLPELAVQFDDSSWDKADAQIEWGPLQENESGVFRARLNVTEQDLAVPIVELRFGRIDENGWVYVNGQKAGESHDWQAMPAFDVKRLLHPGENVIAVAVANAYGPGGPNLGVSLQMQTEPAPVQWQRSVFNGLAQIIVQSSKEPGELKLTAKSDGLASTTATITAQPCTPRPALP